MMVPLYVRIDEDLYKKLKQVSGIERRSMASLVQVLLKQAFQNLKNLENSQLKRRKKTINDVNDRVDRMLGQ